MQQLEAQAHYSKHFEDQIKKAFQDMLGWHPGAQCLLNHSMEQHISRIIWNLTKEAERVGEDRSKLRSASIETDNA